MMSLSVSSSQQEMPIYQKKGPPGDTRLRILVITSNAFKKNEYEAFLGKTYGVNLSFADVTGEVNDIAIRNLLQECTHSPHYILREECKLLDALKKLELSGLSVIENPQSAPKFISSTADLKVWKPVWGEDGELQRLICRPFHHETKGRIDPGRANERNEAIFGWDHLFVDVRTNMTHLESIERGLGKISPRQLVISDFVTSYLFYKKPASLSHNEELKPARAIEFTREMSPVRFLSNSPLLSNRHFKEWGLSKILNRIVEEGVFYKAGTSRPVKTFFSPPFAGIPLTSKKSGVEETVFMMHDLNHHNVPDLIFSGTDTTEHKLVYAAWRMMSEAMTLVIADMLYGHSLVRSNPDFRQFLDTRIYPLFEALDVEEPSDKNCLALLRKLLYANTRYAVLGDDSEWEKLLKEGQRDKLNAYKNHFKKFFVGDHAWTAANYQNMANNSDSYKYWTEVLGEETFRQSNLLFLDDMVEIIRSRGANMESLESVVEHAFIEIFETRFASILNENTLSMPDEEEMLSRAFRRYLIGQMTLHAEYRNVPDMRRRAENLANQIKETRFFGEKERSALRRQYEEDVYYLWGLGIITGETAANYMEIHPIFKPVYISYNRQGCKTVKEQVIKTYGGQL